MSENAGERLRDYVTRALLPTWHEHGYDLVQGGFHERLEAALRPVPLGYRRLLTQCRQIFSFAEGTLLGGPPEALDRAVLGFRFLCDHYQDDARGGWRFTLGEGGTLPSTTRHLYAHAFVLLACSAIRRATGDDSASRRAERTVEYLHDRFAAPNGGFRTALDEEGRDLGLSRQQNPHMHLFEACLMMWEVTDDHRYAALADTIAGLLLDVFLDPETGTLIEFFADDWSPHPESGSVREPGHHAEWAWLLHRWVATTRERGFAARRSDDLEAAAGRLLDWAVAAGLDPEHGGLFDEVGPRGEVLKDTKRIWPVLEAVKGLGFASAYRGRTPERDRAAADLADLLFTCYLRPETGTWVEVLGRDLTTRSDALPGTTPYHIVMAARELNWLRGHSKPVPTMGDGP
jgi:mannose-6-phosphate isomerase